MWAVQVILQRCLLLAWFCRHRNKGTVCFSGCKIKQPSLRFAKNSPEDCWQRGDCDTSGKGEAARVGNAKACKASGHPSASQGDGIFCSVQPGRGEGKGSALPFLWAWAWPELCTARKVSLQDSRNYSLFVYHSPSVPRLQWMRFIFACCQDPVTWYFL